MAHYETFKARLEEDERALYMVMSVSEVMEEFHLLARPSIILACITGRVAARKVDGAEFSKAGMWLIARASAEAVWGNRK